VPFPGVPFEERSTLVPSPVYCPDPAVAPGHPEEVVAGQLANGAAVNAEADRGRLPHARISGVPSVLQLEIGVFNDKVLAPILQVQGPEAEKVGIGLAQRL
jgi:hypothetical protein